MIKKFDLTTFLPSVPRDDAVLYRFISGSADYPVGEAGEEHERFLSYPVTQDSIILGDVVAGGVFGIGISILVWIARLRSLSAGPDYEHRVVRARLHPRYALLCCAWRPARVTGIRQPAQRDDLLEPDPVPAHLHLRESLSRLRR